MQFDLTRYWYQDKMNLLLPLAWLFGACVAIRRFCYRVGLFKTYRLSVPIIVVGNISVGGTGKTPFVIWLAAWLHSQGYRPGIVSRGVGSQFKHRKPYLVKENDSAEQVGDEAILLIQQTQCPMVICVNRVAAARELLAQADCNVVISDDGLQHYALDRDIEIVIVDGERRFGNGCLLPAGPLREPVSRLGEVDMVVVNGGRADELSMQLELMSIKKLKQYAATERLEAGATIHAVAGIGNPERFFQTLRRAGFAVIPHVFPDHYRYRSSDLAFNDDLPVIMTAKDAVKCQAFAKENWWYAEVEIKIDQRVPELLKSALEKR